MFNAKLELGLYILVSALAAGLVVLQRWNKKDYNVGLTILFLANLFLIHWAGAVVHILPWYENIDFERTLSGFRLTTYGILAFVFGCFAISMVRKRIVRAALTVETSNVIDMKNLHFTSMFYAVFGILSAFAFFIGLKRVPSIGALASVGISMIVVGFCLICWYSLIKRDYKQLTVWLGLSLMFPFLTVVGLGFLGFGVALTLIVYVFVARFIRLDLKLVLGILLFAYMSVSFYQNYMRDRTDLRGVLWEQEGGIQAGINQLKLTLSNFELFNPFDETQLDRINVRMNQNVLIGASVDYLDFSDAYARGETMIDSFIALVPRIIWPEKPFKLGGSELVSKYTGITFEEGTTIAMGQVMELYVNFGALGVIVGFFVLGMILTLVDTKAAAALTKCEWNHFALWFLPSLPLLDSHATFAQLVSTVAASVILVNMVIRFPRRYFKPVITLSLIALVLLLVKFIYLPLVSPIFNYLLILLFVAVLVVSVVYIFPLLKRKT